MDALSAMKKKEDDGFFFRVRTENNRLHSVMWSSSSQRESLARYGDVVVFDLTYKTNSLKLPLAAFVGTDNHGKPLYSPLLCSWTKQRLRCNGFLNNLKTYVLAAAAPCALFSRMMMLPLR